MKKVLTTKQRKLDVSLPEHFHSAFEPELLALLSKVENDLNPVLDGACFKVAWLRKNLFSKFYGKLTASAESRREAAIAKWQLMEVRNRSTNTRLRFMEADFGPFSSERVFSVASAFIKQIIGLSPPIDLAGSFTNGASTRVKRSSTAIAEKYVGNLHCTSTAWSVFKSFQLENSPYWQAQFDNGICTPEFIESSEMFTVPKTSDIDRVACKEPEINMFLQRSVGDHFRRKLLQHKCNLNDQTINRRLAREAAFGGTLATIDLSSASDLISTSLVYRLLPLQWVMLLDDLRVKSTMINGEKHELEMFSSMGNGFTFELESLIFLALTRAVAYLTGTKGTVSIYGDDIIAPASICGILFKVLQFCGLKVNQTKSFVKGPFRESCGGHYYRGADVTPFFVRKPIDTWPDLILFLNQFRAWCCDEDICLQFFDERLYAFYQRMATYIPRFLHGGREKGSDFALITPDRPRKRLTRRRRTILSNQQGALNQWLHRRLDTFNVLSPSYDRVANISDWSSLDLRLETSEGIVELDFTIKRHRTWEPGIPHSMMWFAEIETLYPVPGNLA